MAMAWYVVHTHSGYEQKAKLALEQRVESLNLGEYFEEILVPSEEVVETVKGQKRTSKRKFLPGYMLIRMELNNETWHVVKNTPKITGFLGQAKTPTPVSDEEVLRITQQISEGRTKAVPNVQFERGETVRVIEGPFSNFNGVVEEVRPDKGKLRVLVSIFGRSTPVELDFTQVDQTSG